MRDLTKAELEEYFSFARRKTNDQPQGFSREQAILVGNVMREDGVWHRFHRIAGAAFMEPGNTPDSIVLSLFVAAFQMGRECESRLLTAALKGRA